MRLTVLNNTTNRSAPPDFDDAALESDLRRNIRGEVRTDATSRGAYSTDASNYRRIPACVVVPKSYDDVEATLVACRTHGVPIVSRGGGTSLNGQCVTHGVVIDYSKHLNRILEIDPGSKTARVQPGVVLDSLRSRTIDQHGLAYGPDPSTHSHCTFGGMLGNNSCGVHSVLAGRTSDNMLNMDILTGDAMRMTVGPTDSQAFAQKGRLDGREGEIYRALHGLRDRYGREIRDEFPDIPRRVSGFNLPDLLDHHGCNIARSLVGSEGTCVAMLDATVRLVDWPQHRVLAVLGYPSVYEAGDHIEEIMSFEPVGLEGLDEKLINFMKHRHMHPDDVQALPDGEGWLLVEFGGDTRREAMDRARGLLDTLKPRDDAPSMALFDDPDQAARIWEVRESGLGATAFVPGMPDAWPGWEDAAAPPAKLGQYLRAFRGLLDDYGYDCALYGHFGQGCVHCRIDFDLVTPGGIDRYQNFVREAARLVVRMGGSLSAEHGDGMSKGALLSEMYSPGMLDAFRAFKRIWDPDGIMNPGKVIDAPPVTTDLRLGPEYRPKPLRTTMIFPGGSPTMERAAVRCVGVGKCRRRRDAFMCPSYLVTQEEIHSTRGRSRLLFEMVRGDFLQDDWRSQAVLEALDLCLSCKGCKKDCPVGVDMASYKSEFLHHHYAGRVRPRQFYAMGFIGLVSRIGSLAPGLMNWGTSASVVSSLGKWVAGLADDREVPAFAKRPFTAWFREREAPSGEGRAPVLLAPDVFNNHFFPGTLIAATLSLEALGYSVEIPPWRYPALRPLIHYGFLGPAQRGARTLVDRLDAWASLGTPIVFVEPSTLTVLRDEGEQFFPKDPAAIRVRDAARLFSEFLADHHLNDLPSIGGKCVYHAHCHQKAVLEADAARRVLRGLGYEFEEPEAGCCGMAGAFGFERDHAGFARQIGEMNLLPRVRACSPDELVIIEGFSCREQIRQETATIPRHLAELVHEAFVRSSPSR